MRLEHFAFLVLNMVASFAASASCDATAQSSEREYLKSTQVVQKIAELKSWKHSHKFNVTFQPTMDKETSYRGTCYWSVSVYANRPERLELWRTFYVDLRTKRILVINSEGDPVSLSRARKEKTL